MDKTAKEPEYVGADELAEAATEILSTSDWFQEERLKGSVGKYPNARQIRYYEEQKLLTPPTERRRNAPVYRRKDLVTLLLIKKLQEKKIPISAIRQIIAGRSIEKLEELLVEEVKVFTNKSDLDDYRQTTGHTDESDVVASHDPKARQEYLESQQRSEKNEAQSYLESLLRSKPQILREADMDMSYSQPLFSASAPPPPAAAPKPAEPSAESWKRYTIAPGVEIHIERTYKPPRDERERSRIIELIERILHFRSRK